MKTVNALIGNTDNKLTQQEWSNYCEQFNETICRFAASTFFVGAPPTTSEYQNFGVTFSIDEEHIERLKQQLQGVRLTFRQDSIAWLEGETQFIQ